ncbi:MAG: type II toxin-antitoxin system VapC family toxin [Betaproteobacteria bacterium]|nr:type II toxin-antitoxin system VapC family toxin [Betaproteobacteria bacterium]
MRYMLDTDICIYAIKRRPPEVLAQLRAHAAEGIGISSISVAELYFGAEKSGSEKNIRALKHFLEPLEIAEFDQNAAMAYGRIRTALERSGTPIGPLDTQIAAHASSLEVTLVTNNTREFARVNGLKLSNWADLP